VNKVEGNASFLVDKSSILEISALQVNFYSNSFSSGKSAMDDKIYEALKAEKYPKITFELGKVLSNKSVKGGHHIVGTGNLTIAGVTKTITTSAFCMVNVQGELIVSGNHALDMTHYGIVPPKAVFGTITTGKDVRVGYNLLFK
jgi:polyisoprenoid-binding protein YceI